MTNPAAPAPTNIPLAMPNADVSLTLTVETPVIFNYWVWSKPPGGAWTQITTAEVPSAVQSASHTLTLPSVARGTDVSITFGFTGPVGAPVKASATFAQNNQTLPSGSIPLKPSQTSGTGQTGNVQVVLS